MHTSVHGQKALDDVLMQQTLLSLRLWMAKAVQAQQVPPVAALSRCRALEPKFECSASCARTVHARLLQQRKFCGVVPVPECRRMK